LANITSTELIKLMTQTELYNGFGNRFLYVTAKREKLVAFSEEVDDSAERERIIQGFTQRVKEAQGRGRVLFSKAAQALWVTEYDKQANDFPGGILDTLFARSPDHTVRLALIYALEDNSPQIEVEHLRAALAVWKYCRESAVSIFKTRAGVAKSANPKRDRLKGKILEYLFEHGETAKTALKSSTTWHSNEKEFQPALEDLMEEGTIVHKIVRTGAAPAHVYSLSEEKES
jgi:hypothetical protein